MGVNSSLLVKEQVPLKHQIITLTVVLILLAFSIASLTLLLQKSQILSVRQVAQVWNIGGENHPATFQAGTYNMTAASAQYGVALWTTFKKAFASNDYVVLSSGVYNALSANETSKNSNSFRAQWYPLTSTVVELWKPPVNDANDVEWTRHWLNKGMFVFEDYPNAIMWTSIATDNRHTKSNKLEFWMLLEDGSLPISPIASVVIPTKNNGSSYDKAHAYLRFNTYTSITSGYEGMLIFGDGNEIYYVTSRSLMASPTIVSLNNLPELRGFYNENVGWDWIVCAGNRLIVKYIRTYINVRVTYLICVNLTNGVTYSTWTYTTTTSLTSLAPELSSLSMYPGRVDTVLVALRDITTVAGCLVIRKLKLITNNSLEDQGEILITPASDADPEKDLLFASAQTFGSSQVDGNLPFYVVWSNFSSTRTNEHTPGTLVVVRYLLGPNMNQFIRDRTMFIEAEKARPDYRLYPHVGLREIHDCRNQIGIRDKKGLQIQFSISQTSLITSYDAKSQFVSYPPSFPLEPTAYPGLYQGVYNETLLLNQTGSSRAITLGINTLQITELEAPHYLALGKSI